MVITKRKQLDRFVELLTDLTLKPRLADASSNSDNHSSVSSKRSDLFEDKKKNRKKVSMEEAKRPLVQKQVVDRSNSLPSTSSSFSNASDSPPLSRSKSNLFRTRTAPALSVLREDAPLRSVHDDSGGAKHPAAGSILKQACAMLPLFLCLGVAVYTSDPLAFSGIHTHDAVDAFYFCVVTLSTIGYGDITPLTPGAKVFACVFVLIGLSFVGAVLNGAVDYVLDLQESAILDTFRGTSYVVDPEKGRLRIRLKVAAAVGAVILCVAVGAVALRRLEGTEWVDAVYLSVMSVTTVGYGDRAFRTMRGRIFASLWLLLSTLAVGHACLFLAKARIRKRQQTLANWMLERELTVDDLFAADLNHSGYISKSEFVIYKLKEMRKIKEKDILLICKQFNKLDRHNSGKITLHDISNASR